MATLGYALERNARLYPEHLALIYGEQRLTYRALYERASRLASALANVGLKKQDRVSMLAMNCSVYLEYYAAAELSGIIAAPVNFRLAAAEIEYMLNDAMPSVLFFEGSTWVSLTAYVRACMTSGSTCASIPPICRRGRYIMKTCSLRAASRVRRSVRRTRISCT
ncbi:AMP-binding protein [Herbaspirillum sp. B65]|uniref:AMP-binding protein n=1 Tax=Herbaspirillum sp. B65 TaxID=137708 RepID=UPI0020902247|nr:AMP-binding protein [Herbaspirillum sp. B65]